MRIGNYDGRLVIVREVDGVQFAYDVEQASGARFSADPQAVYEQWDEFREWADGASLAEDGAIKLDPALLGPPTPRPRQVLAIGINYQAHANEGGVPDVTVPPTFTKFPTCLAGPYATVTLPEGGSVDWEVELVVVIGRTARKVSTEDAWDYIAGVTVGQDISERNLQLLPPAPQFSLGKSFPNFGPIGPLVVTPDELDNPDDLELKCDIDGEEVQNSRTSKMIFGVRQLMAHLSGVMPLLPGDIIFTGTPSGVGLARKPQRWLQPGEVLTTSIEGLGELRNAFVAEEKS